MEVKLKPKTSLYEAKPAEVNKALLLYSGGLDTSVMVKWLQDAYACEVITLTVDLGEPEFKPTQIKEKALALGAEKAFVAGAKDEFAEEYIAKAIKANGLYQGKYPLSTALGRPLIAKKAVEIAKKEGVDAIAHGSTGKGNDQVRFDASILALAPGMKIIAPVREWNMARDEEIAYAKEQGIPVPVDSSQPYSIDQNFWGKSSECGLLEFPHHEPPQDVFSLSCPPEKALSEPEYVSLEFDKGVPVALNGKAMPLADLAMELNSIAGKHGIGIIDHMEDRIVGLKSREVYECPAATCIIEAHQDLEKFVSTIHENHFKKIIDNQWAYNVYAGLWFEPLTDALNAFIDKMNEKVSGEVKLKLFKGQALVVGRKSDNALYDLNLATYNKGQTFNQWASPGFIELWSLQTVMANKLKQKEVLPSNYGKKKMLSLIQK